jgi:hypothetical protein
MADTPAHDNSEDLWPPADLRSVVLWTLIRARDRIYLVEDETAESGWRCEWGTPAERISAEIMPTVTDLVQRGIVVLSDRREVWEAGATEPVYAYELVLTPSGRVLLDRVNYGLR